MSLRRNAAGLLIIAVACVTPGIEIARADWVVVPSGHRGGAVVISRQQYADELARHTRRRLPNIERIPPRLLESGSLIQVRPGQVRGYLLVDEPVVRMQSSGTSARIFWGRPYSIESRANGHWIERQGADVFIEGLSPGSTELTLYLRQGERRQLQIDIEP